MSDKVKGFVVALENDLREDEIEHVINAIKMVKGVVNVEPIKTTSHDQIFQLRIKAEMRNKFYDFIKENFQ